MLLNQRNRIVFLGDSLTLRSRILQSPLPAHRFSLDYCGSYVDILMKRIAVNFPDLHIEYFNQGIGGSTTQDLLERVQHDVISLAPDVVVVFIGQNDANYFSPAGFKKNLLELLKILQNHQISVVQLSTTPDPSHLGKNIILEQYDEVIKDLCKKHNNIFIDVKSRFLHIIRLNACKEVPLILFNDGCHFSELGNILVADLVFEAILASVNKCSKNAS